MTATAFADAVKGMVGLPPLMRDHLLTLAPKLSDEERAQAMTKLQAIHGDILKTSEELVKEIDAGEAELSEFRRTELPKINAKIEKEEHAGAESILDDTDTQIPPPPPPPMSA